MRLQPGLARTGLARTGLARPGLAIDVGTVNTLVHVTGRGVVLEEPSAIALDSRTGKPVAVGNEAEELRGRAPPAIEVVYPLRDGVIADLDAATSMLSLFLRRAALPGGLMRPLAVVCVPRGATWVERRALSTALTARRPHCVVELVEEPIAAVLGAGADPAAPDGAMVVDVGGGTSEVALVAAGGIVQSQSLRVGGNAMDEAVVQAVKAEHGLVIGQKAAERLKITLGLTGDGWAESFGVDRAQGSLRRERVPGDLVARALEQVVVKIADAAHEMLSETPPDVVVDIAHQTIRVTGGGALLDGLAQRIGAATGLATRVVDDPLRCLVHGAGEMVEHRDGLRAMQPA